MDARRKIVENKKFQCFKCRHCNSHNTVFLRKNELLCHDCGESTDPNIKNYGKKTRDNSIKHWRKEYGD